MKDIDNYITGGTETTTGIGVASYQPGNGTRYSLLYGNAPYIEDLDGPHHFFCTWFPDGGGGVTVQHSLYTYCHFTYVSEKMGVGDEDAKAIAHFINSLNCRDYPDDYSKGINHILPRGIKKEAE